MTLSSGDAVALSGRGVRVDVGLEVAVGEGVGETVTLGDTEGVGDALIDGVGVGVGSGVPPPPPPPPPEAWGITTDEAAEAAELPATFVATTENVYPVPLVRPETVQVVEDVVHVNPPGDEVAV